MSRRQVDVFTVGPEFLLTVPQAARLCNIHPREIKSAIKHGELSAIFIGKGEPRVPRWLIVKWQEQRLNAIDEMTDNVLKPLRRRAL